MAVFRRNFLAGLGAASLWGAAPFHIAGAAIVLDNPAAVRFHHMNTQGPHGRLHVLVSRPDGKVSAPPVLCLHPSPYSGRYFRELMQMMGRDRVMLAPDYPGLGQSAPSPQPLSMAGIADAMATVLDAMEPDLVDGAVDVIGYHAGALVAAELITRHPHLVGRIVPCGVPLYREETQQTVCPAQGIPQPMSGDYNDMRGLWSFALTSHEAGVTTTRYEAADCALSSHRGAQCRSFLAQNSLATAKKIHEIV